MNVLTVILLSLGCPLLIAGMILGFMKPMIKASATWHQIPPDVLLKHQMRFGWLRPAHLWIAYAVCTLTANIGHWFHMPSFSSVLELAATVAVFLVLPLHFIWAIRILRRREQVPATLFRFARYAAIFTVIGFAAAAVDLHDKIAAV
jgi:hypothetical protein